MRLLLVEDFAPLRRSLSLGLREAGYAVDQTGDGEEALWYARGTDYDGIVLDLMLPGLDGLSVLRCIRKEGRQTPVLILTAKDAPAARVEGLDAGADDYLVKPFSFPELLARLRALLRRRYGDRSPVLSIGELELDTVAGSANRAGRPLELTAREYALLAYLAHRTGEIVTRSEIWEHLYDERSEVSSNVVDVYIGYLRKKLRHGGASALIHTVRGRGYRCGPSTED